MKITGNKYADSPPGKNAARLPLLMIAILALGVFFRLWGLGERDLWTDEAWVALAVAQEDFTAVCLQGNAEMGNHTPPLYLLTVWTLTRLAGDSEAVLRLTSLLFGLGTLGLSAWVAWRLLPPGAAVTAALAVAVSTRLVYFSKELKPYAADAFFAVLAVALTERLLQSAGRRGWLAFFLALAAGLGYSHAAVFTLPVVAAVLWWRLPAARRALAGVCGGLAVVFLGYYLLFYQGQARAELVTYWQGAFPDTGSFSGFVRWLAAAWQRYLGYLIGDRWWWVGLLFLLTGVVSLLAGPRARTVVYFLGPLAVALAAAFLHRYPFMAHAGGVRLMLFSAPLFFLVLAAGIWALWPAQALSRFSWLRPVLVAALLVCLNPHNIWTENLHPQANREEIQPLVRYLEAHRRPGDLIYVYYFAVYPFRYYYQGPTESLIWGQSCHEQCLTLPPPQDGRQDRLWLIFSHFEHFRDLEKFSRRLLGDGWQEQERLVRPGAALFCFTRRGPAVSPPATGAPSPGPS